jgi:outer membrane biosynthesis protein TonB
MEATPMKLVGIISAAVLSLTLGVAAPAYAQQEQRDQQEEQKKNPAQQETKKAQSETPAKQNEKPAAHEEKTTQQAGKNTQPQEKNAQQQDKNAKQEEKNTQQQHIQQAKPGQEEQRAGGNGGGRIPDDRFKANFGREHSFRVSQGDYRDRHFQYGGYSFGFVDPWPSNWIYTQDVYVVEINGVYYLCNPMYPGVNLALSFTP